MARRRGFGDLATRQPEKSNPGAAAGFEEVTMRLHRPRSPAPAPARRGHEEPSASEPEPAPAPAFAAERRLRAAGGPEDHETYVCRCGAVFPASPTTSVSCPLCGVHQAW